MIHHNTSTLDNVDITIVGGGMVGLLAAVALQNDYKILLIDPAYEAIDQFQFSSYSVDISQQNTTRISAINPVSQAFFDSLGVWSTIQPAAYPYKGISVKDTVGRGTLEIDGQSVQQYPMGWMTENQAILYSLQQAINPRQCQIAQAIFNPAENTAAKLADGLLNFTDSVTGRTRSVQSSLIIAADGAQSAIRNTLEIPHAIHKYNHHGVVTTIQHSDDNLAIARQWFIGKDILAFLPIDQYHCSIVWSTTDVNAVMALSDTNFCECLNEYSNNDVGHIIGATKRIAFPLAYGRSKRYHQQRVVLIGDAAHQVHPLAGLGANLGFMDVIALKRALNGEIKISALQKYQRHRQVHAQAAQQTIDWLYKCFQTPKSPFTSLRGAAINIANNNTLFKKKMAQFASGVEGFTDFPS
jgi:2-octaprenylphenol hydroxylase